jgi:xanthine dehydrogenase accessory factor
VLTHGHALDEQVLEQLLRVPVLPYIGMVGSSKKIRGIRERLLTKGINFGPHVYSPAGLALGGNLPGDIALAILAEIKLVMEGGQPGHLGQ